MKMPGWVLCAVLIACGSEGGSDPTVTPDAAPAPPRCGDGVCEASEVGSCQSDCGATGGGSCGDGTCSGDETTATCPNDCPAPGACGDGSCATPETADTCPGDCTTGGGGTATCGNLACEAGEDAVTCPTDCGGGGNACPGTGDVDCFFCWFDSTTCIEPQTEAVCEACLGLGGGTENPCTVDGVCDLGFGEDETNCPSDCP